MLSIQIHAGLLADRTAHNQLASMDIAYQKKAPLADYLAALTLRQSGELEPRVVANYPRWSGSLWDLVARALTQTLYKDDVAPPSAKVDRRCAYATKLCVVIQGSTQLELGRQLATAEILQEGGVRGRYTATFREDILGERVVCFEYGCKALNPADLLLRAICHALFGKDTLSKRPSLILPPSMLIEGKERFDVEALSEPARTGFARFRAKVAPLEMPEAMPLASQYVHFLMGA